MGLNIKKLPKTMKFLFLAKDIISGYNFTNSKGGNKDMVILKAPFLSTDKELLTFQYPAGYITTYGIDIKTGGLKFVDDEKEAYQVIQLKYKEKSGDEKGEFRITKKEDDKFIDKFVLTQEDFFKLLADNEQEIVNPWIEEKVEELKEIADKKAKEGTDTNGKEN